MKTPRLYGAGLLVALLLTLAACGTSGGGTGREMHLYLTAVAYGNGLFVAVGGGVILTSPDGVSWRAQALPNNSLNGATYGNGTFVVVGGYSGLWSSAGVILTSPDGVSWTARASGTGNYLFGVAYGNGLFVAVGPGGTILTSLDGVNWTRQTPPTGN